MARTRELLLNGAGDAQRRHRETSPWARDTWRMWRADVDLPPGGHSVRSRATAADGVVQTPAEADPVPDGATGWPEVSFSVF